MMPSPASILLGFDHIEVSPIKGRLQSLFEPPERAVSPLPLTPEKSQVNNIKVTFIVIEDSALNDLDLVTISSEVAKSPKRDSNHLELPTVAEKESASNRFQAAPSAFIHSTKANSVRTIRNRAMDSRMYSSSVIPFGYAGVKERRK